jgi:hypothetical protein
MVARRLAGLGRKIAGKSQRELRDLGMLVETATSSADG